ncbi:MAG TPA: glycosyltransferase N-terminal domain-containing protein, partial [Dehalococcoidia bacterium]|nr:glycosyltransferase N-terminal domain-containing protein [Dehalococcoidia bacterium]
MDVHEGEPRQTLHFSAALAPGQTAGLYSRVIPMTGVRLLYSASILCLFAFASPYFLYQAIRHRKYVANLWQRLGHLPESMGRGASIWIQAVSVGEVLAARALIPGLREQYPGLRLVMSTTTLTGQQVARTLIDGVDDVFYFPFDLGFVVARTLDRVDPRLFVMMETEIWPNLLHACRQRGVTTVLVNGRVSPRSYRRYRLVRPLFRRVLEGIDGFCVQSEESARRLISLGADPNVVTITGSLKFDSLGAPQPEQVAPGGVDPV